MNPSFFSLFATGLLLLIFIIYIIYLYANNGLQLDVYQSLAILLLFTIAAGIHGLQHADAEKYFGYNPLQGKWNYQ